MKNQLLVLLGSPCIVTDGFLIIVFKVFSFFFKSFIFGCAGSSLLRLGFPESQWVGATLWCGAWASHCSGLSCCRAQALGAQASGTVVHGLRSCESQASLLCSMWNLPRAEIEPAPALAVGFSSAVPPAKSSSRSFLLALCFSCVWVRISLSLSYCKLLELHEFGTFLIIISSHSLSVLFPFPSPGIPTECMWG